MPIFGGSFLNSKKKTFVRVVVIMWSSETENFEQALVILKKLTSWASFFFFFNPRN